MPFEDGHFDAAYELEATVHSPDLDAIYSELFRVLKPGGHFAGYAWAMTDKYDPENAEHKKIKYGIEIGNGLPPMHTKEEILIAMKKAGLKIIEGEIIFLLFFLFFFHIFFYNFFSIYLL